MIEGHDDDEASSSSCVTAVAGRSRERRQSTNSTAFGSEFI